VKSFILAAAAIGAAATAPAVAQTTDDAGSMFTGPRVELHGGWNRLHEKARINDGTTTVHVGRHDYDGFVGGQIGYDYAIRPSTIVGVFGSYDLSNNKQCSTVDTATNCFKANRNIEGGARIGEVFGKRTLVYVKGAYVNGRFRASSSDTAVPAYASDHADKGGWRAGVGVEEALSRHAYVKAEYNYSRYGRFHDDLDATDTSLRIDRQEALAGLGIRF
jgi:outer membrane immunogenic protein